MDQWSVHGTTPPVEYHSHSEALHSPVHNLHCFLSAFRCRSSQKRAKWLGEEQHVATIVLQEVDGHRSVALEMSTTHDLHHTWIYDRSVRTESNLLILGDDKVLERVAVTAKEVSWNDYVINIHTWNPGPLTESELANLLRDLLIKQGLTEAATKSDSTIIEWLRCLYANAYERLLGLWLPYAATPIALISDVARAHCCVEVATDAFGRLKGEGTISIESDFDRLPADDQMWAHEWNFLFYYCTRRLVLPPEAVPALGKDATPSYVEVDKLHILRNYREFMAVDSGDMASKVRDEAIKLHEPPPRKLVLRLGAPVVLTADVGTLKSGETLKLVGATDSALTCQSAADATLQIEKAPYTIHLSTSHGSTTHEQSWTRLQFPLAAAAAAPAAAVHIDEPMQTV